LGVPRFLRVCQVDTPYATKPLLFDQRALAVVTEVVGDIGVNHEQLLAGETPRVGGVVG
jgi:hypothetical protein